MALIFFGFGTLVEGPPILSAAWFCLTACCLVAARLFTTSRRFGRGAGATHTVAIVDVDGAGHELARRMRQRDVDYMRLVGVFSAGVSSGNCLSEPNASVDDLISLSRQVSIDEVVITTSRASDCGVDAIIKQLRIIPADVRLCNVLPDLPGILLREPGLFLDNPTVTVQRRPLTGWNSALKRFEDVVLGSLLLIATLPLLAVIALLVKTTSPGPILFRQKRLGLNNCVIDMYKFRSMRFDPNPDAIVRQASRNDQRVTPVGRVLRRTSLDELPQLLNVLRGDMSLVGPRPHALAHNDQYAPLIDNYLGRHRVKPGITGWAQIKGFRGETDTLDKMQRRVDHDLAYIDQWSIGLDLRILTMTAITAAFGQNAY